MKAHLHIFLFALALTLPACAQTKPHGSVPKCCHSDLDGPATLSDRSIYQVQSTWTNDAGKTVGLADLRGQPQVITMFFAKCEFACPVLVHDMQEIEAALPKNIRSKIGFTLISFDTERDTPEVLAAYRKQHDLNANWTLLRGKPDDVQEIAALLGVKFKKDARGQFAHSNIITLLNADGEIVKQQVGLGHSGEEIVKAVEQLLITEQQHQ